MQSQLSLFKIPTIQRFPSTRYQGSKQKFIDWIFYCIKDLKYNNVLDAFGGTGAVAYKFKQEGKQVVYNDILPFNYVIGKALIENKEVFLEDWEIENILKERNDIQYPHFIEDTFKNIYYTEEENHWLDVVITNIRNINNEYKQSLAYFALFQSCIIKRPYNLFHRKNLYVRMQDVKRSFGNKVTWDTSFEKHFRKFITEANGAIFDNKQNCYALNKDAFIINNIYDLVYIDTPYINNDGVGVDYGEFYHFLNGILFYDNWSSMIDYNSKNLRLKKIENKWNNSNEIKYAFEKLFYKYKDSILVISYRSNGIPTIQELVDILIKQNRNVKVYQSNEIKYVLSNKQTNECLIVSWKKGS